MLPPPYLLKREQIDGVVVETWSDGYCVQKGRNILDSDTETTITFPVPFKDNNITIICTPSANATTSPTFRNFGYLGSKNGFSVGGASVHFWEASGYIR